jgi:ribonuclease-3
MLKREKNAGLTPKKLAEIIGYRFRKAELMEQAFIHPSYRYENDLAMADNQRLEFLGDAVLGLLAADALYRMYPDEPEGKLTQRRSQMTSGRALATIARKAGLGDFLKVGKGELQSGGQYRQGNLADVLEALLGAAWLDGGQKAVQKIFDTLFLSAIEQMGPGSFRRANPKGALQEKCQALWKQAPAYVLLSTSGPAHQQVFTVSVRLPDGREWQGKGAGRQSAEVAAAGFALDALDTSSGAP